MCRENIEERAFMYVILKVLRHLRLSRAQELPMQGP